MRKPKGVKDAFRLDYIVKSIYDKGGKEIRVDMTPRIFNNGKYALIGFWINRKFFQRTYTNIYNKFC